MLLGEPETELSLTEIAERTSIPYPSVHREIERGESAGILTSRRVGNVRLVSANTTSPYYEGLADVLVKAFGPPTILAGALCGLEDVSRAMIFGSWAARFLGESGKRPVGDIDLLVLGTPDRDRLYQAVSGAEMRLGRPLQVTVRPQDWLATGSGAFHANVADGPLVEVPLTSPETAGPRH